MSSLPVANFASCLGKYDSSALNGGVSVSDASGQVGTADLSLNAGAYLTNAATFVYPQGTGNGFSYMGWFYPSGPESVNATPLMDISTNSAYPIVVCCSGTSLSPCLSASYNNSWLTTQGMSGGAVTLNAWNFFAYTVCCSGNLALQNLYLNAATSPATSSTTLYDTTLQCVKTYVAYGTGAFANSFVGKVDDFRFYGRVITPMEYRVLQGYNYGTNAGNAVALIPNLGTVDLGTITANTVSFVFSNTGTYSYVFVYRSTGGITTTFAIKPSNFILQANNSYTWTDTTTPIPYLYYFVPYVLSTSGTMSASYYAMSPIPIAITNVVSSAVTGSGFTVTWSGGTGTAVTTTYTINGSTVTPSSSGTGTATFTSLTSAPWTLVITATNGSGSMNGSLLVTTDMTGTSSANSKTYKVRTFTLTGTTYTVTYTNPASSVIYILAVGGGGVPGAGSGGGGGGAGGVVMQSPTLPAGTNQTITINVGAGSSTLGVNGSNTTVTFNGAGTSSFTAYGGGYGGNGIGNSTSSPGNSGGSGGGGGNNNNGVTANGGAANTSNNNIASAGAAGNQAVGGNNYGGGGGGGGAGGPGTTSPNGQGSGGPGIKCNLTPINNFSPNGTPYGNYYWAGGGSCNTGGNAGLYSVGGIGGGAGGYAISDSVGTCLNLPQTSYPGIRGNHGGNGGVNTGGGGATGDYNYQGGGASIINFGFGGSGIVIIAFDPTITYSSSL